MPFPHRIIEDRPNAVVIELIAWDNKQRYQLVLEADAYYRWMDGELIQRAFPSLGVETRELLISGTSPDDPHGVFRVSE